MSRIPSQPPIQQTATDQRGAGDLRDVDLDSFLQLMIAELQNQDPLNPLDNAQLLQQIGQIREISATDQLSDTLGSVLLGQNVATASSLIGKRVTALTEDNENVEGRIDRVTVDIDERDASTRVIRVHIGEDSIRLDNIREIVPDEAAAS